MATRMVAPGHGTSKYRTSVTVLHLYSHRSTPLLQFPIELFGLLTMHPAVFAQFTRVAKEDR